MDVGVPCSIVPNIAPGTDVHQNYLGIVTVANTKFDCGSNGQQGALDPGHMDFTNRFQGPLVILT